jgi:chromosome segregation ATPase
VADDLLQTLTRFHREVVMPDVLQAIDRAFDERLTPFRNEVNGHFDAIYKRFDKLETEYYALCAAVARLEKRMESIEKRMGNVEQSLDAVEGRLTSIEEMMKIEIRNEIDEIKRRIATLQERVAELEAQL